MSRIAPPAYRGQASSRRRLLAQAAATLVAAALAGCGGGGDDGATAAPTVTRFEASGSTAFVGDNVRLYAEFTGGNGRIEPDVGAVASGSDTASPGLDRDREFRLVVERAGAPSASRTLAVRVRYRDRYRLAAMPFVASHHAAVATGDGAVLLIGGSRGESTLSTAVDRFDPATGRITRFGSLLHGRAQATATRLADGRILVAGGASSSADARTVQLIDERTGRVSAAGALSITRTDHAAVLLASGAVLVLGGYGAAEGEALGISHSAEIWEPATGRFRRLAASMVQPRAAHTATRLADGRVLVVGGYSDTPQAVFAEIFDPATETFTPLASPLTPSANHAALLQPDGGVLVLGGERAFGDEVVPLARVLRFDPQRNTFAELPALARLRTLVKAAMLPGGQVLLFGGQHDAGSHAASAERYDPAVGGRALAELDGERAHHTVTRLESGRIAVIGGEGRAGPFDFRSSVQLYE